MSIIPSPLVKHNMFLFPPLPAGSGFINGLWGSDPNFFPITVWLQNPQQTAQSYKNIGINVFNSIFNTPTAADMAALRAAGMLVILSQQSTALGSLASYADVFAGWQQYDEPDNAQNGGASPCISSVTVIGTYNTYKAADPVRPVSINFGEAAANPALLDRGATCFMQNSGPGQYTYTSYSAGADILSFDIYPRNNGYNLTVVADGVDNLLAWCGTSKPVWAFIECTKQFSGSFAKPTTAQVKAEVWLAITHGASGIQYFPFAFDPEVDNALLVDGTMSAAVAAINSQIASLATVLNSRTGVPAASLSASGRIDYTLRRSGATTYLFAVNPSTSPITGAQFTVTGAGSRTVTVIGESRTLAMVAGVFTDNFSGGSEVVHLYSWPT